MKIGVCGYYGMGNFGDELFLKTFQQVLRGHEVFPHTSLIDSKQIDAVIVGGGDLIIPYHYNSNYFPPSLIGRPAWIYGVGVVDNYPDSSWPSDEIAKHRAWMAHAHCLYTRDANSAAICRKHRLHANIATVPDIVFGYEVPHYPILKPKGKRTIGVCIHTYSSFPFEMMASILSEYAMQGFRILLIPVLNHATNPYSDMGACVKLQNRIRELEPNAHVETSQPHYELELTYSSIQAVDYLITFKLHPAVAAIRGGVPVFCISTMSKVYQLLAQFGLEANYFPASSTEEEIREGLERWLNNGPGEMQQVLPYVREVEQASRSALQLLRADMEDKLKDHS